MAIFIVPTLDIADGGGIHTTAAATAYPDDGGRRHYQRQYVFCHHTGYTVQMLVILLYMPVIFQGHHE